MNKKTELLKSTLLALLVATSVVLFANSWLNKPSSGENENLITQFASAVGLGGFFNNEIGLTSGTDVISPVSIIYTSGAKRVIFNKGTDMYNSVYGNILSVLLCAENGTHNEKVSSSEWYSAQKTQGIYLNYGVSFKRKVFEKGTGCPLPEEIKNVSAAVLTSNDSATNKLVIYIYDYTEGEFYKLLTSVSARTVEKLLSDADGYTNIPIAEELGFSTDSEINQQIVIDGNAVINLEQQKLQNILFKPISGGFSALDNRNVNLLLSLFDMSKSSAKQYADIDGTMYIDTYGTLRFSEKQGVSVLEFNAAKETHGVSLESTSQDGEILYDILYTGYSKACAVSEIYETDKLSFYIASDITTPDENGYTVQLDYISDGVPVFAAEEGNVNHAVTMKFNLSGELIYYKQYLFELSQGNGYSNIPGVLDAINLVYSAIEADDGPIRIKDISTCYKLNETKADACLCVITGKNGKIYTIPSNSAD